MYLCQKKIQEICINIVFVTHLKTSQSINIILLEVSKPLLIEISIASVSQLVLLQKSSDYTLSSWLYITSAFSINDWSHNLTSSTPGMMLKCDHHPVEHKDLKSLKSPWVSVVILCRIVCCFPSILWFTSEFGSFQRQKTLVSWAVMKLMIKQYRIVVTYGHTLSCTML